VVEDIPILSAEYLLPLLAEPDPPCSAVYLSIWARLLVKNKCQSHQVLRCTVRGPVVHKISLHYFLAALQCCQLSAAVAICWWHRTSDLIYSMWQSWQYY